MMSERLLEVDGVSKEYRLGQIGGGTLHDDLTSVAVARLRGKEDPNTQAGRWTTINCRTGTFLALDDVLLQRRPRRRAGHRGPERRGQIARF